MCAIETVIPTQPTFGLDKNNGYQKLKQPIHGSYPHVMSFLPLHRLLSMSNHLALSNS